MVQVKRDGMSSVGLPTEKSFLTTSLRSLENGPFLEHLSVKEANDHG